VKRPNHHCSVVAIAGRGVLVEGPSGAGKTSLALGLVDTALARGLDAALVADDQALLEATPNGLTAHAPAATAGLAELRGYGIARMAHVANCPVALVVRLAPDETLARLPAPATTTLLGVELPLLLLPARHESQAVRIVLARLAEKPSAGAAGEP